MPFAACSAVSCRSAMSSGGMPVMVSVVLIGVLSQLDSNCQIIGNSSQEKPLDSVTYQLFQLLKSFGSISACCFAQNPIVLIGDSQNCLANSCPDNVPGFLRQEKPARPPERD